MQRGIQKALGNNQKRSASFIKGKASLSHYPKNDSSRMLAQMKGMAANKFAMSSNQFYTRSKDTEN